MTNLTEDKQAEETLREQAAMLNLAPILTRDLEDRITFWNQSMEDLYGWSQTEALGQISHELLQTRFPQPLHEIRAELWRAGSWQGELRHTHQDGSQVVVASRWVLHKNKAGQPVSILEVENDITEQKRTEAALRLSEEQFAKAFQASPDALTISRENGIFLEVNPSFEKIFGYSRQEALGNDPVNLNLYVDPSHRTQIRTLYRSQGFLNNYEVEFQTKTGEKRYSQLSIEPITINNESYLLTINRDITDRKQVELALRASEERFRELFENAKDIIYTLDLQGNLTSLNRVGELIFGYRREELLHQSSKKLIAPEYMEQMGEMRALKLEGVEVTTYELEVIRKDGRRVMLEVSSRLIYEDGIPVGIQGIARDITERKWAEAALRQAHEALEQRVAERTATLERTLQDLNQFTYAASHDLKAPLRAVKHLAGWIAEDAGAVLSETSKTHLAKLENRVERMEKFLDDLLIYSRIERQYYQNVENVEVKALIEEVIEVLAPPPGFTLLIQPELPKLRTQRVLLELVFKNLIENAIKHHHRPEGQVEISAREFEEVTEFTVTDDGPGIDPAFHDRIFQIFQTLRPRDEVEGSGAGLAIVKKVVESRGGTITVISAEGEGATFRFTWPKN